jgi:hypothetical protein
MGRLFILKDNFYFKKPKLLQQTFMTIHAVNQQSLLSHKISILHGNGQVLIDKKTKRKKCDGNIGMPTKHLSKESAVTIKHEHI